MFPPGLWHSHQATSTVVGSCVNTRSDLLSKMTWSCVHGSGRCAWQHGTTVAHAHLYPVVELKGRNNHTKQNRNRNSKTRPAKRGCSRCLCSRVMHRGLHPSPVSDRMSPRWSLCSLYSSHARWSYRRRLGSLLVWACVQCVTSIVRAQLLPIVCCFRPCSTSTAVCSSVGQTRCVLLASRAYHQCWRGGVQFLSGTLDFLL